MVADGGGNGVHINLRSGHGVYKSVNELGLPNICTLTQLATKLLVVKRMHIH